LFVGGGGGGGGGGPGGPGGVTRSLAEKTEDLDCYFEDCAAKRQSRRNSS
jgi:hypothetical protein